MTYRFTQVTNWEVAQMLTFISNCLVNGEILAHDSCSSLQTMTTSLNRARLVSDQLLKLQVEKFQATHVKTGDEGLIFFILSKDGKLDER